MRNLLTLVGLVVVGFAILGWYCGWYQLSVSRNDDGKREIKTTLDTNKVGTDTSAFFQKMGRLVEEKSTQDGKAAQPAGRPGNTPAPETTGANGPSRGGWFVTPRNTATKTGNGQ